MLPPFRLSSSQNQALRWLAAHNGTGVFGRDQVLVAGGERGPFMTTTWLLLCAKRLVVYEYPETKKLVGTRVTVTNAGREWLRDNPEPTPVVVSAGYLHGCSGQGDELISMQRERTSRNSIRED